MQFSLEKVPFSRRGSWFMWNRLTATRAEELGKEAGLYFRTARGGVPMAQREIFRVEVLDEGGREVEGVREVGTPAVLRLEGGRGGVVEVVFADGETLRMRGRGCGLRLQGEPQVYDYVRQCGEGVWEVNLFSKRQQFLVRRLGGEVRVFAPWSAERSTAIQVEVLPGVGGGEWEVELLAFESTAPISWGECVSFDAVVREVEREFEEWLRRSPVVLEEYAGGRELAAYVQWAALVGPCDRLKREGMLMSKNWMVNVWSWDHCFNAIALAAGQSELAWEQWALPFDYQNRWGALPDCVNDYDVVWNFTKPPVHGWALREMIARGVELGKEQVKQAAEWLELWTEWWLRYRDDDGDGLPQYNHGNDSGWDNATLFAHGMPVEGPDLAAYLVVQMEVVADLWDRLGKGERAEGWRERAKGLVGRLLEHSVRGGGFVAPRAGDHAVAEEGDCLLRFLPLLLGARLPEGLRRNLVQGVMEAGRFLTEYGLATESPRSRLYVADGYWRGPIWAPSTLLLVSGLRACGERELAEEVGRRFCRMVVRSGCAENFDALTGAPLRDQAYTWTASVFLDLGRRQEDEMGDGGMEGER